jgi:endonuclease/exonuclease/phosphatase family metal-dependent hydrolase
MSDHRFEQRGLLHAQVLVENMPVHVVVVHMGLIPASRLRQAAQICQFIEREVPPHEPLVVAGDFNDWGQSVRKVLGSIGLRSNDSLRTPTYPSRLPLAQLDHVYVRGLGVLSQHVPHGRIWWRMSDHLPLIVDLTY